MSIYEKVMRTCYECKHHSELGSVPANFCNCFNIVIAADYARLCDHHAPGENVGE